VIEGEDELTDFATAVANVVIMIIPCRFFRVGRGKQIFASFNAAISIALLISKHIEIVIQREGRFDRLNFYMER